MSENSIPNELRGIVDIVYLNRDNCKITEKNGFLGLRAVVDKKDDPKADTEKTDNEKPSEEKSESKPTDGDKEEAKNEQPEKKDTPAVETVDLGGGKVEKRAERIFLSRAFPFDMPYEYISVLDRDKKEIGFIRSLDDFDEPERQMLKNELDAKYYTPIIKRIISVKERYGFSYWKCECEFGEKAFTLRDTFRSIVKAHTAEGRERIYIIDIDGNRYEIPDTEALDRVSYKKLELYL